MLKEKVDIRSKGATLETATYESPETLEEAIKADGPEKVFALFSQQRKIRFMDARRRALTGGGVTTAMAKALKAADPKTLLAIAEKLGNDDLVQAVSAVVKAESAGK